MKLHLPLLLYKLPTMSTTYSSLKITICTQISGFTTQFSEGHKVQHIIERSRQRTANYRNSTSKAFTCEQGHDVK